MHFGFGIDEEVGAGDDLLAFAQAGFDGVEVSEGAPDFDEARLEFALAFVDENEVARAGGQDGAGGDCEAVPWSDCNVVSTYISGRSLNSDY